CCFFFQAEDGIRDFHVTGVQTCALPICQVQLQVGSLVNQGGKVLAAGSGALQVQARERLDNSNGGRLAGTGDVQLQAARLDNRRSEERRVGKEGRSRWSVSHENTIEQAW